MAPRQVDGRIECPSGAEQLDPRLSFSASLTELVISVVYKTEGPIHETDLASGAGR